MAIQADNYLDLVATTLNDLDELKWTDLTTDLQEMIFLPKILKKEKVGFQSGIGIKKNILLDHNHSARNVGLYTKDRIDVADGYTSITVPWRHTTASWAVERRVMKMNREPARIVDLVDGERKKCMISLAEKMEENGWGGPADSADDVTPHGITYWLQTNATEGFNGGDPTAGARGGLSSTTQPRWANWSGTYAVVSRADLIRKMKKAATMTKFIPPVKVPRGGEGRYGYYTNYSCLAQIEERLQDQNDNLGPDVAAMEGQAIFRRTPIVYVPYLDRRTDDPVIGINWRFLEPVFLEGEYLAEEGPDKVPGMHTTYQSFIDLTWNLVCSDLRRQWILYKA